jgi:hypothetical protein
MKFKLAAMMMLVSVLALALPSSTNADVYNKKTIVTFNVAVEIPGVGAQVLPPGKYVFRLVDSLSSRDIVQILNEDETHVFATILAIPNYRLKVTDGTVMKFAERTAGSPQAIKAWFYPGNTFGQEFVYPKAQALEIAKASNEPVLEVPTEFGPKMAEPVKTIKEPAAEALLEAPVKAIEPSGEEVEIAQVIPPPELPKTASHLPLVALAGLLSIVCGLGLSLLPKRAA